MAAIDSEQKWCLPQPTDQKSTGSLTAKQLRQVNNDAAQDKSKPALSVIAESVHEHAHRQRLDHPNFPVEGLGAGPFVPQTEKTKQKVQQEQTQFMHKLLTTKRDDYNKLVEILEELQRVDGDMRVLNFMRSLFFN